MKTLSLFLLFIISNFSFAQKMQGIITYEMEIGDDPRALLREIDTQRLREAQRLAQELSFNLYFTTSESYFEINEVIDNNYFADFFVSTISAKTENTIYCDLNQSKYYYSFFYKPKSQTYLLGDNSNYNWDIIDESKVIDEITVYKAIGTTKDNQRIEAWFAPEIPISAGPGIYIGLPGLILELQIGYTKYITKKIEFTDKYTKNIKKIVEGKPINENDYLEITQEHVRNMRSLAN